MAEPSTAPPRGDPKQKTSGNLGVYSPPEAPDTFQSTTKNRIGVYDRPEGIGGSWSPMVIFSLVLGVLLLLWILGIFDSFLG